DAAAAAPGPRRRRAVSHDRCLSSLRLGVRDDPRGSRRCDRRAPVLGLPAELRGRSNGQRCGGLDGGVPAQSRRGDPSRSGRRLGLLGGAAGGRLRELRTELWIGVALCVCFTLPPYLWFVSTSLKTPVEITAVPPRFWPSGTLSAYRSALFDHG